MEGENGRARRRAGAALVICLAIAACAGGNVSAVERLCGDSNQSLLAIARELQQVDGEAGLAVFGARLNELDVSLGALEVTGEVEQARNRATTAIRDMQTAAGSLALEASHVATAANALRELDAVLCP